MNHIFARFQNVEGMNAKSNAIVSLLWLFFLTLLATITYGIWGKLEIILYCLSGLLVFEVITIIIAYFFFAITNPDCLRSETFTLNKIAMEKGYVGDSNNGIKHKPTEQAIILEMDEKDNEK